MNKEVAFVGGATVSLYTDSSTGESRPTDDVDILIEVAHYTAFAKIKKKLRKKGFVNDTEPVLSAGILFRESSWM
jgi:hypothetical protein